MIVSAILVVSGTVSNPHTHNIIIPGCTCMSQKHVSEAETMEASLLTHRVNSVVILPRTLPILYPAARLLKEKEFASSD